MKLRTLAILALALSLCGCFAESRGNASYHIKQTAAGCFVDSGTGRESAGPVTLSFTAAKDSCTLTVTAASLTQGADRSQSVAELAQLLTALRALANPIPATMPKEAP